MPGFNQQGPMNQGPMTGRGMGACTNGTRPASSGLSTPGPGRAGMGFRRGRGCGQGAGFGQGGRFGAGYGQRPMAAQPAVSKEGLMQRADLLESELNVIKEELANLAND